jgi:Ca2+-binding RTX toxin-like protein
VLNIGRPDGNDTVYGDHAEGRLIGGGGRDTIRAGSGIDTCGSDEHAAGSSR